MQKRNSWIVGNTKPNFLRNSCTVFHSCWTKAVELKESQSGAIFPGVSSFFLGLSILLVLLFINPALLCPWRGLQREKKVSCCKTSMPSSRWDVFAIIFFLHKEAKTSWVLQLCEDGSQAGGLTLNSQIANWRQPPGKVRSSVSSSVKCLIFPVLRTGLWWLTLDISSCFHKNKMLCRNISVLMKCYSEQVIPSHCWGNSPGHRFSPSGDTWVVPPLALPSWCHWHRGLRAPWMPSLSP